MTPITCRMQKKEVRPLTSLPFDVICNIIVKLGAKSPKDVFKYRSCCKVMKAAGESSEVYRELDIFGILNLPIHFIIQAKRDQTLNKYKQHENLLLMFRDRVFDFITASDKTKLQMAGEKGQKDAIFLNAMLLLVESRQNKEAALRMLNTAFRSSGTTVEVQENLCRIRGLMFSRKTQTKLIFHWCPRTCRTHVGNNYGKPFFPQYQWILDCNVCFWEACFVKFAAIFEVDYIESTDFNESN